MEIHPASIGGGFERVSGRTRTRRGGKLDPGAPAHGGGRGQRCGQPTEAELMCQEVVHVHSLDRLTSAVLSEPPRGTPAFAQSARMRSA